jgi:hypothetical protein
VFQDFIRDLNNEMRIKNPWQSCSPLSPSIQSNRYMQLLQGSHHHNNFEFLHSFLSKTHHNSQAAGVIGVHTLVRSYSPFFLQGRGDPEKVSQSLALHFSHWLTLMEPSTRPKQILTFFHMIFHHAFQANLTPLVTLYHQILAEVVTVETASSQTIEEEETPQNMLSVFILTTAQFLSDSKQATVASQLLLEAVSDGQPSQHLYFSLCICLLFLLLLEGHLPSHQVDHNLYGSLVIRAVPRNLDLTAVPKKGWKRGPSPGVRALHSNSQATAATPSPRDSNPLLDSLFSIHAIGSTPADALVRDTFYKVSHSHIDSPHPSLWLSEPSVEWSTRSSHPL